jgi:hypothetical protein
VTRAATRMPQDFVIRDTLAQAPWIALSSPLGDRNASLTMG